MTSAQRRIVVAVCVLVGLTLLVAAGLTFLVAPMAVDLGLSDAAVEDALVLPTVAALAVVFVAGRAGDRWGARRAIVWSSVVFSIGSLVLATARSEPAVQAGLALCGIGAIVIQVVAVSLLQQTASDGPAHVSAFTTYGMVFPVAFLVLPIVTALVLGQVTWRWVPVCWAAAGVVIALVARAVIGQGTPASGRREWATPLLAGLALAAGSTALSETGNLEIEPAKIIGGAGIGVLAAMACVLLVRRIPDPSFSLAPLGIALMRPLMAGVALLSLVQLLTFVSIGLEYLYDLTAIEAALAIAPAQLGAVVGAKAVARRAVRAWGPGVAGRRLMLLTGMTTLPLALLTADSDLGFLVVVATLSSCAGMAALTVVNLDIMGRAPHGGSGAVSALRTSASSVGGALGMAVLGTIVLSSIPVDAGAGGIGPDDAAALANALRVDGVLVFVICVVGWAMLRRATATSATTEADTPAAAGQ